MTILYSREQCQYVRQSAISVFTPLLRMTILYSRAYQILLLAKPIWLQKLYMESRVLAWVTTECLDAGYPKLKTYISQLTSYSYECNTISVRHNALHYLALIIMNIRHEHNMFHICALCNIYIVMYQHIHTIKYACAR
jgi:hypothetical protein